MIEFFLMVLQRSPYHAITIGLLLPQVKIQQSRKILSKLALSLSLLHEVGLRSIYKNYLEVIMKEISIKKAKQHTQLYYYRHYNINRLERKVQYKIRQGVMAQHIKVKLRKYYNNFNSMEEV